MLKSALEPYHLNFVASDSQLVVTRSDVRDGSTRQRPYSVDDLATDTQQLATLGKLVQELIAADSWKAAGGPGSLQIGTNSLLIDQSELVHFQILVLLEKLRVARGLAPRSKYDPSLFRIESRTERAAAQLSAPVTVNYIQPAPLTQILDRLGKQSAVQILVDWRAAADAGWSINADATLSADKEPLGDTLQRLLQPMDLTYRVVDAGTLQITTPELLHKHIETELYDVGDLVSDKLPTAQLLVKIRSALGEHRFREGGGKGVLGHDAPSRYLLASLPQPQQIALAKLLNEWRSAK
jgi:hypothetical protein